MGKDSDPSAPVKPCVYFIRAGAVGAIKIGTTRGNPHARLRDLQTGNPEPLVLLAAMPGGPDVERGLHERFADSRLTGEWFRPTERLLGFVEGVAAACEMPEDDGEYDEVRLNARDIVALFGVVPVCQQAMDIALSWPGYREWPSTRWGLGEDWVLKLSSDLNRRLAPPEDDWDEDDAADQNHRRELARLLFGEKILAIQKRFSEIADALCDEHMQEMAEARLAEAQRDGIDPSPHGVSAEIDPYPYDVVETDEPAPESGPRMAVQ